MELEMGLLGKHLLASRAPVANHRLVCGPRLRVLSRLPQTPVAQQDQPAAQRTVREGASYPACSSTDVVDTESLGLQRGKRRDSS